MGADADVLQGAPRVVRESGSKRGLVIAAVERRKDDLMRLSLRYKVKWLDLFGSVASGEYDPERSDLDFLVEFQPEALALEVYSGTYFGLYEDLERLFGRPVDLVEDPAIKNPYFRESVDRTRIRVYEA